MLTAWRETILLMRQQTVTADRKKIRVLQERYIQLKILILFGVPDGI